MSQGGQLGPRSGCHRCWHSVMVADLGQSDGGLGSTLSNMHDLVVPE